MPPQIQRLFVFLGLKGCTKGVTGADCAARSYCNLICRAMCFAIMVVAIFYVALDPLDMLFTATTFLVFFHSNVPLLLIVLRERRILHVLILPDTGETYTMKGAYPMALFVIADLHLSSDGTKSMEKFGARWTDYMQKLRRNWNAVVKPEDTVIVPGDISWSLKLEDAEKDLRFLDSMNGQKLIGKGNHDFWWSTASKMKVFFAEQDFSTLQILYNNAYVLENCIVCGTRGWFVEESQQNTVGSVDYLRIVNREVIRLRMSLEEAAKLQKLPENAHLPILVFLHFPPVWNEFVCREIVDILHEYKITSCYFGHIHGAYYSPAHTQFEGIDMRLIAADYLNFAPFPIRFF